MYTTGYLNKGCKVSFSLLEELLQDIYITYRNYQRITRTGVLPAPRENQEDQCMFQNPVYNPHPKLIIFCNILGIFYHITFKYTKSKGSSLIKSVKIMHQHI